MKPPSVLQPDLTTDVCRSTVLAKERELQKLWVRRARLEREIAEIDRQIGLTERGLSELRQKYEHVKATGEVDDDLLPDGSFDAKQDVRKKYKAELSAHRGRDEADLADLRDRLSGSKWRFDGQARRRDGVLTVRLANVRRSRSRAELRADVEPRMTRAVATYADRYRSGAAGLSARERTTFPKTKDEREVAKRWRELRKIGVMPPAFPVVEDQRPEPCDVEDEERRRE